jgi:hypothetical protein
LAGAQIMTRVGSEVFKTGRIAEEVLVPFVHATAHRILAPYLHSTNGVDDGSTRRCLLIWFLDAAPIFSFVAHSLNLAHVKRGPHGRSSLADHAQLMTGRLRRPPQLTVDATLQCKYTEEK